MKLRGLAERVMSSHPFSECPAFRLSLFAVSCKDLLSHLHRRDHLECVI